MTFRYFHATSIYGHIQEELDSMPVMHPTVIKSFKLQSYTYSSAVRLLYFFFNFGPVLMGFSREGCNLVLPSICGAKPGGKTKSWISPCLTINASAPRSLCDSTIKALVLYTRVLSSSYMDCGHKGFHYLCS